jgi:flagellar hook capping protein FlgD
MSLWPHGSRSKLFRMAAPWALLVIAWLPSVAHAFTFTRTGDGSSQVLTYIWIGSHGNCTLNHSCGNVTAIDGRIPLNPYVADLVFGSTTPWASITLGGSLDWTASSGQLHAVHVAAAWPTILPEATSSTDWLDGSPSMDARTAPLIFQVVSEAGDPPFTRLQITPHLDGAIGLFPAAGGASTTTASANLQLYMRVEVNGRQVSRDSLVTTMVSHDGLNQVIPVAFPKGAGNSGSAVVSNGSVVTIYFWSYITMHAAGIESYAQGQSAYGEGIGPAMVVDVQDAGTTDVPGATASSGLQVRLRPNPSRGLTRVAYAVPRPTDVRLSVYDLAGARVATLVDRFESAGGGEVAWDGTDSHGGRVAAGMYVVELVAGSERVRGKLVVLGR